MAETGELKAFHEALLSARKILAVVGAGVSVASGLQTFRGANGLWRNYSAIDLATPDAFHIDPGLVWQFYSSRRFQALRSKPNRAHYALAELSQRLGDKFMCLTQNVDGLHQRAGHVGKLLELHGSLFRLKCTEFFCEYVDEDNREHPLVPALAGCEDEFVKKRNVPTAAPDRKKRRKVEPVADKPAEPVSPEFKPVKTIPEGDLPHCPKCKKGLLRPGVVWFGESIPIKLLDQADAFIADTETPVDLVLVIGTSGTVWPANGYVEQVKNKGGKVAIFNIEMNYKDDSFGDFKFQGDCSELLPEVLEPLIGSEFVPRDWKRR